jgi:hypothetical protein
MLSQGAVTRANLDDQGHAIRLDLIRDPARDGFILEEILAEAFFGGKLHGAVAQG